MGLWKQENITFTLKNLKSATGYLRINGMLEKMQDFESHSIWVNDLVCMANFLKNWHFLPPDMHTHVCVTGVKKC